MKKAFKIWLGVIVVIAVFVSFYIGLFCLYKSGFSYGTYINDVYCTGKSVSEINDILCEYYNNPVITIVDSEKKRYYITSSDYDFNVDFSDELTSIFNEQNPLLWGYSLLSGDNRYYIEPSISCDEKKLSSVVSSLNICSVYENEGSAEVYIYSDTDGYHLYENYPLHFDENRLLNVVDGLKYTGGVVSVSDEYFYKDELSDDMKSALNEWDKLQKYLETKLVYDMGDEKIYIDEKVLREFLRVDKEGNFIYDDKGNFSLAEEKITEYIDNLCDEYDTVTLPVKYTTFFGEEKYVDYVERGTLLDKKAEEEYFFNAVINGIKEIHTPKYLKESFSKGKRDVGQDFIEVDTLLQKLYLIKDGKLLLETDVVTGMPSKKWATPKMIVSVYAKRTDVVLKGQGYASPVSFWMPVYKGIGLHDASWQPSFGGERYLEHGSRGCINLSYDDAKVIFDNVYVGFPVIIY